MKKIFKKKYVKINELLRKAFYHLENSEFDESLKYYSDTRKLFELMSETDKTSNLVRNFSVYSNSMETYLGIKEALILAQDNRMDDLKHNLDFIWSIKDNIKGVESIRNFAQINYKYCMNIYLYNIHKKEFLKQIEDIYSLLYSGWTEESMKKYSVLLKTYNSLVKYGDYSTRAMLHNKIMDIYREIRMKRLKEQAYSEVAEYNFKGLPKKKEKIEVEYRNIEIEAPENFIFNKSFKDLKNFIKNNDVDNANTLLNNI